MTPNGVTARKTTNGAKASLIADTGMASAISRVAEKRNAMPSDSIMMPLTATARIEAVSMTMAGQGMPDSFQRIATSSAQSGGSFSASYAVRRKVIGS